MSKGDQFGPCPRCHHRRLNGTDYIWALYEGEQVCWRCSAILGLYLKPEVLPTDDPRDLRDRLVRALSSVNTEIGNQFSKIGFILSRGQPPIFPDMERVDSLWRAIKSTLINDMDSLMTQLIDLQEED